MTKQEKFINDFSTAVVEATNGTGLFPSVKMAQMALETGWGSSYIRGANNAFGIKSGAGWKGRVISASTREVVNGVSVQVQGTGKIYANRNTALNAGVNSSSLFRVYGSLKDSIKDHTKFLIVNPRYSAVLKAETPEQQAQELQKAGYATGTNYANTLISIINKHNLKNLDLKKKL